MGTASPSMCSRALCRQKFFFRTELSYYCVVQSFTSLSTYLYSYSFTTLFLYLNVTYGVFPLFFCTLLFSSALQCLLPVIHAVSKASWVSPPSWETVPEFDTQPLSAAAAPSSSIVCARCLVLCSILLASGIDIEDPETIWHELIDRCPAL